MAPQLDEAMAALRALVNAARNTYGDYYEDVWGPRADLRDAVSAGARVLGEALCPECKGAGITPDESPCPMCGGLYGSYGDGLAKSTDTPV